MHSRHQGYSGIQEGHTNRPNQPIWHLCFFGYAGKPHVQTVSDTDTYSSHQCLQNRWKPTSSTANVKQLAGDYPAVTGKVSSLSNQEPVVKPYPYDIDTQHRERVISSLQSNYDRFSPADFEMGDNGNYQLLPEGEEQSILGWIYPATHLILSPRPGRETEDRLLGKNMILRGIRQGQYKDPDHIAHGVWYWTIKNGPMEFPRDRNTPGFMGCAMVRVWHNDPQKMSDWSESEMEEFRQAIRLSVDAGERFPIRIGYTNPQMLDFYLAWAAADILGDQTIVERARKNMADLIEFTEAVDSVEEFVSPTYMGVNLTAIVPLNYYVKGTADEEMVSRLHRMLWQVAAIACHAPTSQVCGPHSRAYADTTTGRATDFYSWLNLAAPDIYQLDVTADTQGDSKVESLLPMAANVFNGLGAPGLYVPLDIPQDAMELLRSDCTSPTQTRENVEWISRNGWHPPFDLTKPDGAATRFRLITRYKTDEFCLGTVNEIDCWLQRRMCLAYWRDDAGEITGLKWHLIVDFTPDESLEGEFDPPVLCDWTMGEAMEFISLQNENEVIGAFHTAPVVAAREGDVLINGADSMAVGYRGCYQPNDPVAWLLGTHWKQPIERKLQIQHVDRMAFRITPIGNGKWTRLDDQGRKWLFASGGTEAAIELASPAALVREPNQAPPTQPVECLDLLTMADIEWDWLETPEVFLPFALRVQPSGSNRQMNLAAEGDSTKSIMSMNDMKMSWIAPDDPSETTMRTWKASIAGKDILPRGYKQ